jgi:hypothetical protein
MGYTHYWNQNRKFSNADWQHIEQAWSEVVKATYERGILLSHDNGDTTLSAHDRISQSWKTDFGRGPVLAINGFRDEAHETFVISKNGPANMTTEKGSRRGFDFTKTAGKPYDAFVTAMLIWLEHTYPKHISVRSDGDASDWNEGLDIALRAFGEDLGLDYPRSLRFNAQWKSSIVDGDKYRMMARIDGATCILKDDVVICEFIGQISEDVATRGVEIAASTKDLNWEVRYNAIDREIRKIAKGAEIIGGQVPSQQILGST